MKNFHLTQEQLFDLRISHKAERNRNAAYKINAIILLGTGWKLKKVKEVLLLDEETLRSYVNKYRSGGISELVETQYPGRQSELNDDQLAILHAELDENIYLTTNAIIEFVKTIFAVTYTISGMRDLLHREGYTFKKPKLVPGEPDIDRQEDFVRCYEKFMETKDNSIEVVFIDAVHPEHNTMAAYGWIKKGEQKKLKTNSGRQRLNLHGAINAETMEMTLIESDTINRDSTVQLLEIIEQKYCYATEIIVILDNAGYHYSKEVNAVVEQSSKLKLVYLPPYSPELNLIERVWRFFKKKVLYNKYYENIKDFRKATIQFFQNFDDYADELHKLLGGGFEGHHYA